MSVATTAVDSRHQSPEWKSKTIQVVCLSSATKEEKADSISLKAALLATPGKGLVWCVITGSKCVAGAGGGEVAAAAEVVVMVVVVVVLLLLPLLPPLL